MIHFDESKSNYQDLLLFSKLYHHFALETGLQMFSNLLTSNIHTISKTF